MTRDEWYEVIKENCESAGTYQSFFNPVIDSLASILEKRDKVQEQYEKSGSKPLIKYTNKGGNTNPVKNPLLIMWDDLNKSALTYWKELGLTPSGLKKLTDNTIIQPKKSALAEALKSLEM